VYVDDSVKRYVVGIVEATRKHPLVYLGASPRGSLALFRTAQALAFLRARDYVLPDDVKVLADLTLSHRLILSSQARVRDMDGRAIVAEVLAGIPVPGAHARGR
jgi:MoxR-like ATPase